MLRCTPRRMARASAFAALAASLAPSAAAQPNKAAPQAKPAAPGAVMMANGLEKRVPTREIARGPLSVKRQMGELGLEISSLETRVAGDRNNPMHGFGVKLSLGQSPVLPFWRVAGYHALIFRSLDPKSFAVSFPTRGLEAGIRAGVIELAADVGVSLFTVDAAHAKWSFGMFTPRASAIAGLAFKGLHVRAVATTEYLWRWVGEPNAYVQSVGLQLVVGSPAGMLPQMRGGI